MKTNRIESAFRDYYSPQTRMIEIIAEKGVCASDFNGASVNSLEEDNLWGDFFNE